MSLEWIDGKSNTIADALSHRAHDASIGIQVNVLMDIDHSKKILEDVRSLLQQNFSSLISRLKRGKADA